MEIKILETERLLAAYACDLPEQVLDAVKAANMRPDIEGILLDAYAQSLDFRIVQHDAKSKKQNPSERLPSLQYLESKSPRYRNRLYDARG